MKKITIVVAVAALAALLALGVAGCGKKDDSTVQSSPDLLGAWSLNAAFDVTPEAQALMDKALEGWTGATYVPVAYIATQPVSGTNHLFVCRETMVVPDAQETWALVTLYEQLDGTVTISDVQNSGVETYLNGLMGGWQAPDSPEITAEVADAFNTALEGWTGSSIRPLALLSKQVVSGMNYLVFSSVKAVAPDAEPTYALVTVYADLQGNARFTDIYTFDAE